MMKKDIKWLKKEIASEMLELEPNRKERWSDVKYQTLRSVAQKIDQLDEPEVLSQEWIDENVIHIRGYGNIFKAEAVENLLVPTLSEMEKVRLSQKAADELNRYKELGHSLKDLLVIAGSKQAQEKLARAWLDGYEVEEEQKYFVSSRESVGFWFLSKNNDNEVVIGTNKDYYDRKWESLKLTEEEIKDYDSSYWAFAVKVEEVAE